jgi:hypothetical protein
MDAVAEIITSTTLTTSQWLRLQQLIDLGMVEAYADPDAGRTCYRAIENPVPKLWMKNSVTGVRTHCSELRARPANG